MATRSGGLVPPKIKRKQPKRVNGLAPIIPLDNKPILQPVDFGDKIDDATDKLGFPKLPNSGQGQWTRPPEPTKSSGGVEGVDYNVGEKTATRTPEEQEEWRKMMLEAYGSGHGYDDDELYGETEEERIRRRAEDPLFEQSELEKKELGESITPSTLDAWKEEQLKRIKEQEEYELDQVRRDEEISKADLGLQKDATISGKAGIKDALSQGREGIFGSGTALAQKKVQERIDAQWANVKARYTKAVLARDNLKEQIKRAAQQNRVELVESLGKQLSRAEQEIRNAETEADKAAAAVLAEERALKADQRGALNTFTGMIDSGVTLDTNALLGISQQLDVPFEVAYGYYKGAENIRDDKSLSLEEKQVALDQGRQDLNDQINRVQTAAAQNVAFLDKQTQQWRAQGITGAVLDTKRAELRQMLGIETSEDPLYQAKVREAQLNNLITERKLEGKPVGYDEWAEWLENAENAGGANIVIPTEETYEGGDYEVNQVGNGVFINVSANSQAGQCGNFVNNVFGENVMVDSYADKKAKINSQIPVVGSAFIMGVGGKSAPYGHTGIVESIDYVNGVVNVVDSNWSDDEKIQRHSIPINSIDGYYVPSKGNVFEGSSKPKALDLNDNQRVNLEVKLGNNFERYAKESRGAVRNISTIETGWQEAQRAMEEGASLNAPSQALLVTFQKMLDPTSVVRESEYARSGDGQNLKNILIGKYQKLTQGGAGVTMEDLEEFYNVSKELLRGYEKQQVNFAKRVQNQAESYGLNLDNILTPDVIELLNNYKEDVEIDPNNVSEEDLAEAMAESENAVPSDLVAEIAAVDSEEGAVNSLTNKRWGKY